MVHVAYHQELEPVWCNTEEFEKLIKTGKWFDNPKCKKKAIPVDKSKKVKGKVNVTDRTDN